MDKLNAAAGGGPQSEQKEDGLDKGTAPFSSVTVSRLRCLSRSWLWVVPAIHPPPRTFTRTKTDRVCWVSGIDFVQERVLGQGAQNNESAIEQAKDEQVSDFIRGQYKNQTGKEFFVKDK